MAQAAQVLMHLLDIMMDGQRPSRPIDWLLVHNLRSATTRLGIRPPRCSPSFRQALAERFGHLIFQ